MSDTQNGMALPDIIKTVMASKGMEAKDVAEAKGVKPATLSEAINKPSMTTKNLCSIFEAMGEKVTFVLSNGNKYTLDGKD